MLKDIKSISFFKDTALSYKEYFQLEIKDDKNLIKYSDEKYTNRIEEKKPIIIQISDEKAMEFIDKVYRIIYKWNERYENKSIIDGVEWRLQIKYNNNEIEYYSGKNDYPNNFEYIDIIIHELLKKAFNI